ncbi:AAA family ATPase [Sphaerotilus mobilis]|uniref:AAA family ATPase n=1 Tax=Sphaerotilus mobilis TaxID=47994 RepID=UPI001F5E4D6F|nr:AAA family ATPase [Sphaerotilus mobilis]
MFDRARLLDLRDELAHKPAVALLGPRQTGKTTLALVLADELARAQPGPSSLYLDLESERDRARLGEAELSLSGHLDKLVILDEVHRVPALFPLLRGLIGQALPTAVGRASACCWVRHRWTCWPSPARPWPGASPTWNWHR